MTETISSNQFTWVSCNTAGVQVEMGALGKIKAPIKLTHTQMVVWLHQSREKSRAVLVCWKPHCSANNLPPGTLSHCKESHIKCSVYYVKSYQWWHDCDCSYCTNRGHHWCWFDIKSNFQRTNTDISGQSSVRLWCSTTFRLHFYICIFCIFCSQIYRTVMFGQL